MQLVIILLFIAFASSRNRPEAGAQQTEQQFSSSSNASKRNTMKFTDSTEDMSETEDSSTETETDVEPEIGFESENEGDVDGYIAIGKGESLEKVFLLTPKDYNEDLHLIRKASKLVLRVEASLQDV